MTVITYYLHLAYDKLEVVDVEGTRRVQQDVPLGRML